MKNLIKIFQNPKIIGVNKKYSETPNINETLIVISKQTQYIGKFITSNFGLFATLVISPSSPIPQKYRESCWLNIYEDPTKNIVDADQLLAISKQQDQKKLKQQELLQFQKQLEIENKQLELQVQEQKANEEKIKNQYLKEEEEIKNEIEIKKNKKSKMDENFHFFETQYKHNNQREKLKSEYNQKLEKQIQEDKDELNKKFNLIKQELDMTSVLQQQQLLEVQQQYNDYESQNKQYRQKITSVKMLSKNLKDELDSLTQKLNSLKMQNTTLKHDQTTLSLTSTYIQPAAGIDTDLMCIICAKRPRVMINMPCRHISHCAVCQKASMAGKHKICWICGNDVRKTIPRRLIEIVAVQNK